MYRGLPCIYSSAILSSASLLSGGNLTLLRVLAMSMIIFMIRQTFYPHDRVLESQAWKKVVYAGGKNLVLPHCFTMWRLQEDEHTPTEQELHVLGMSSHPTFIQPALYSELLMKDSLNPLLKNKLSAPSLVVFPCSDVAFIHNNTALCLLPPGVVMVFCSSFPPACVYYLLWSISYILFPTSLWSSKV